MHEKKKGKQKKERKIKMSNVVHPAHYNIPGRKECIEEMRKRFGDAKVEAFCELNSYKYRYRHELKNGKEDLEKASNYELMLLNVQNTDRRFIIANLYGIEKQENQLIEEMSELIQAICKKRRDRPNNIIEELADVKLVLDQVIYLLNADGEIHDIMEEKINRTLERAKNNADS